MKKQTRSLLAALCVCTFSLVAARAEDAAKIPGMNKAPAAAAEALKKYAADNGMKIGKVSVEKHGKVTVYEAALSAEGKPDHEVSVTADGKVKGEEETVQLDSVPEAPRKAIQENAKGAKISRVQKIKEDGVTTYEAAYVNAKGRTTEVEFLEDGKVKPEEK